MAVTSGITLINTKIQKSESPKRNPPCCGAVDAVNGEEGIRFSLHLFVAFVGAAHFHDKVAVDAEITRLDAAVFNSVLRRMELVAEESFAHRPDFRLRFGKGVK